MGVLASREKTGALGQRKKLIKKIGKKHNKNGWSWPEKNKQKLVARENKQNKKTQVVLASIEEEKKFFLAREEKKSGLGHQRG